MTHKITISNLELHFVVINPDYRKTKNICWICKTPLNMRTFEEGKRCECKDLFKNVCVIVGECHHAFHMSCVNNINNMKKHMEKKDENTSVRNVKESSQKLSMDVCPCCEQDTGKIFDFSSPHISTEVKNVCTSSCNKSDVTISQNVDEIISQQGQNTQKSGKKWIEMYRTYGHI